MRKKVILYSTIMFLASFLGTASTYYGDKMLKTEGNVTFRAYLHPYGWTGLILWTIFIDTVLTLALLYCMKNFKRDYGLLKDNRFITILLYSFY